jgi:uncharacterized protein YecE (DUF72 family)
MTAQSRWLEYYSSQFRAVEVNGTFYRLPNQETFAQWAARTPDDFVFALKASRYLTHMKRLREPEEPVSRLLERSAPLAGKLGPILLQLPPNLEIDLGAIDGVLSCFPPHVKVAVEPRHSSWFVDEFADVLRRHNSASCVAISPDRKTPMWKTADWGYVRFHEGQVAPTTYGRRTLTTWAGRLRELFTEAHVYIFFDNDTDGCAPRDALTLASLTSRDRQR